MRAVLKDLEIKAEATKTEEAGTITEASFNITVEANLPKDRIERIHQLTLKGCPVGKIFDKAGVKSNFNLEIKKE